MRSSRLIPPALPSLLGTLAEWHQACLRLALLEPSPFSQSQGQALQPVRRGPSEASIRFTSTAAFLVNRDAVSPASITASASI